MATASSVKIVHEQDADTSRDPVETFARDVLVGFGHRPKTISSKYLYDDAGSELFSRIMDLPEYYPTQCEVEILSRYGAEIAALAGDEPFNLVELGSGDGRKTELLLGPLLERGRDFRYVPIDISEGALSGLADRLAELFPALTVRGLVSDYFAGLRWLRTHEQRRNLVLFLGSNIGNFMPEPARVFLAELWHALNDGDLALIGFDMRKNIRTLTGAYDDEDGVTHAFNLNLLERMNRELGANFVASQFVHYAQYNSVAGAMESYLVSTAEQDVAIPAIERTFHLDAWEPIHVESSFKYLDSTIARMAAEHGFVVETQYKDSRGFFTDSVWRVVKEQA